MNNQPDDRPATGRDRGRAHPAALVGFALLVAGLVAWAWLGDWRWVLTGVAGLVLGAVVASARRSP